MKIELRGVKVHPDMSDETTCFSATLWADGKKIAAIQNEGRGGCDMVSIYPERKDTMEEILKKLASESGEENGWSALEDWTAKQIDEIELNKALRRDCKRGMVYYNPEAKEYFLWKCEWKPGCPQEIAVLKKYPKAEIINYRFVVKEG